jgi:hypothetical protein
LCGNVDADKRGIYIDKKKSAVSLQLIRKFLNGSADKAVLTEAAKPSPERKELLTDTKIFLMQQQRNEVLRERLDNSMEEEDLSPEEAD